MLSIKKLNFHFFVMTLFSCTVSSLIPLHLALAQQHQGEGRPPRAVVVPEDVDTTSSSPTNTAYEENPQEGPASPGIAKKKGPMDFKGSIEFSEQEKQNHLLSIRQITSTAANCLQDTLKQHQTSISTYGLSKFYGDQLKVWNKPILNLSWEEKKGLVKFHLDAHFARKGLGPVPPSLLDRLTAELEPISCVGLARRCLERGFVNAGQKTYWDKISEFTRANDQDGTALQFALQKLGWKVLYWNPDPSRNQLWDNRDKAALPNNTGNFWGRHTERYNQLMLPNKDGSKTRSYYGNPVDDVTSLVGFKDDHRKIDWFKQIPLFIGTAHTGYHVFPGSYGQVIEGHSKQRLDSWTAVETAPFNPMMDGGAPRGNFFSGLIAIPPGSVLPPAPQ